MPPQTILGYSHPGVNGGAMATPIDEVIPVEPNCQTTRLLANAPRQPAAKKTRSFFIVNPKVECAFADNWDTYL